MKSQQLKVTTGRSTKPTSPSKPGRHQVQVQVAAPPPPPPQQVYFYYPFDFWEILGSFILPEEVGTFARLCRDSYAVVNRPQFWVGLYERHFKPVAGMPERLRPDCMCRARGLKANVVRALYYTYDPFVERTMTLRRAICDPHVLKERICVKSWQTTGSSHGQWKLFIKFQHPNKRSASSSSNVLWDRIKPKISSLEDAWDDDLDDDAAGTGGGGGDEVDRFSSAVESSSLMRELADIDHNSESECSILHITSASFCRIPASINGLRLVDICKTMTGSAFQFNRLRLKFVPAHYRFSHCDSLETVIINDIVGMKVYDWYHPSYEMCEGYVWAR